MGTYRPELRSSEQGSLQLLGGAEGCLEEWAPEVGEGWAQIWAISGWGPYESRVRLA